MRDGALGLSGFVSLFGGRICRGAYPWKKIGKFMGVSVLVGFFGGPICGGGVGGLESYLRGEAPS